MVTVEDENGIVKSVPEKPKKVRAQRWSNVKQQKGKDLVEYIDSEKHFSFRPYTLPQRDNRDQTVRSSWERYYRNFL